MRERLGVCGEHLRERKKNTYNTFVERIQGSMFADSHGEWQVDLLRPKFDSDKYMSLLGLKSLEDIGNSSDLSTSGWLSSQTSRTTSICWMRSEAATTAAENWKKGTYTVMITVPTRCEMPDQWHSRQGLTSKRQGNSMQRA